MRFLFLSILMIGVGVGVVGCEDDESSQDDVVETEQEEVVENTGGGGLEYDLDFFGTTDAVASGDDGGNAGIENGFIIVSESGTIYDPAGTLPESFKVVGLRVRVFAVDARETSVLGRVINIVEIRIRAD